MAYTVWEKCTPYTWSLLLPLPACYGSDSSEKNWLLTLLGMALVGKEWILSERLANECYKSLFSVVKLILILSHGQATVGRSLSVNKEVKVQNLKEHTLVAQRIVCDHVNSLRGILKVGIKQALVAVSQDVKTTVREIPWSRKAE